MNARLECNWPSGILFDVIFSTELNIGVCDSVVVGGICSSYDFVPIPDVPRCVKETVDGIVVSIDDLIALELDAVVVVFDTRISLPFCEVASEILL